MDDRTFPLPAYEFVVDLDAAIARAEIAELAARATEHVNRSFGQLRRHSRDRFRRAAEETGSG